MNLDKGLVGGSSALLVLSLLSEGDHYGYEMIRLLEERSDQTFQFKEGSLYPVLHRLENSGFVESYFSDTESGKRRKYYKITRKGEAQLLREKEQWRVFTTSVNKVIGGEAYVLV